MYNVPLSFKFGGIDKFVAIVFKIHRSKKINSSPKKLF